MICIQCWGYEKYFILEYILDVLFFFIKLSTEMPIITELVLYLYNAHNVTTVVLHVIAVSEIARFIRKS